MWENKVMPVKYLDILGVRFLYVYSIIEVILLTVYGGGLITVTNQINCQPTKMVSILRLLLNFGAAILLVKVIS